jgi:acyl-CoA hydrolase
VSPRILGILSFTWQMTVLAHPDFREELEKAAYERKLMV